MTSVEVANLAEFRAWVRDFKRGLKGDEILLLSGDLGAGKTEFVKSLASEYGVANVMSPTFSLHRSMQSNSILMDHFDLYRLENLDELESAGIWDLLQNPSLTMIEWPERVPDSYWPRGRKIHRIRIEKTGADSRRLILS